MTLLQVLWRDYDDFSFFRLRVLLSQTTTVSSIFFLHLVGCCFLRLVCYCVRVRFDGRVLISSMTNGICRSLWRVRLETWPCRSSAVRHWLPTAAARVRIRAACGVCGGQTGTGAGFLRVLRFPLPIIPPISPLS
jgi:hypothetical protein